MFESPATRASFTDLPGLAGKIEGSAQQDNSGNGNSGKTHYL
jgi:hypothetical protein